MTFFSLSMVYKIETIFYTFREIENNLKWILMGFSFLIKKKKHLHTNICKQIHNEPSKIWATVIISNYDLTLFEKRRTKYYVCRLLCTK